MKSLLVAATLLALCGAPALAASPSPVPSGPVSVHVRGRIVGLAGNQLTVGAPMGPATTIVTLVPNFRVTYVVESSLAAIAPGSYIGTAAVPQRDGSLRALGVTIFPPGVTPNPGTFPFDLTPTSTMTNGTIETIGATKVDNAAAGVLSVTYDGGAKRVIVAEGTPVVKLVPADASALVAGARVSITAKKDVDGTLSAANVNVGKDGLTPPY
jgi:hypothetical protein